jgi:hypothetical protein
MMASTSFTNCRRLGCIRGSCGRAQAADRDGLYKALGLHLGRLLLIGNHDTGIGTLGW